MTTTSARVPHFWNSAAVPLFARFFKTPCSITRKSVDDAFMKYLAWKLFLFDAPPEKVLESSLIDAEACAKIVPAVIVLLPLLGFALPLDDHGSTK
jgi:hypothetical protein